MYKCFIGNILAGSFVVLISTQLSNFINKNTNKIKSNDRSNHHHEKYVDKENEMKKNEYVVYEPKVMIKQKKEISGQAYLKLILW